eukprot:CAMPEP_0113530910 /NCGR_PEP_ID=MMETSP0015_2-20120614/3207_1 /TAXON_ID=2838 /ORGANISM="Odontella" /LENGTH=61 /DNA_ID=CAMNT_0000429695 /DNA_START=18 /DNA_END=200 /DNA_ORIENTATION=+ /assembly_acc=CAM_ASM_000160
MNVGAMNKLTLNTAVAVPDAPDLIATEMNNPAEEGDAAFGAESLTRRTVDAKKSLSLDGGP